MDLKTDSCGLYGGRAGNAILSYILYKKTSNTQYNESALTNLNEISNHISEIEDLGFANGLAGVGWAVERVAQNGFLAIDTNEILEEIDDMLYKSVMYSSDNDISLANGALGKFLFFLSRHRSRNADTQRMKSIFHEECLVLLTDDLHERICGRNGLLIKGKLSSQELIDIGHTVYFLSEFLWTRVNEPSVEKTLYACIAYADTLLEKVDILTPEYGTPPYIIFLACCYYLAARNHRHQYWKDRAVKILKNAGIEVSSYYSLLKVLNKAVNDIVFLNGSKYIYPIGENKASLISTNVKMILIDLLYETCEKEATRSILDLLVMV